MNALELYIAFCEQRLDRKLTEKEILLCSLIVTEALTKIIGSEIFKK